MKDNTRKPEIRFSGFDDDWEQRKFEDIAFRVSEISTESGLPRVEYEDIIPDAGILNKDISKKHSSKTGVVFKPNDVLFGKLRPYLKNWMLSDMNGIAVGDFWVLRSDYTDAKFLYYLLQTPVFQEVANQSTGTKMPRADWNLVSKTTFRVPADLSEQSYIGSYFHSMDNLIALHQRKYSQILNIKQSMLEKMFPQDGAKAPEIRFSGFTDDWEQRKLGEFCEITTGKLDANAMVPDGKYDFYTSGIQKYKINRAAFEGPAITIAGNGATVGYMHLADGLFNAYQRTYVLSDFKANRQYLYYAIGKTLPSKISAEARTGSIPYIVRDMLTELEIFIPSDDEQIKVGEFLKSLDNLITLHQRKLEQLQNIKKSCLDKMFVS